MVHRLAFNRRQCTQHARPGWRCQGFTLVELMMVVGVIAVLALLALPKYADYRERLRVDQAKKDIVMMSVTIATYYNDARAYPASLADVGLTSMLDPWGRAYAYLPLEGTHNQGHARKDHALVPINTDFDLYSLGPDGRTAPPLTAAHSRDDIVRANNGKFVGPASTY